MEEQRDIRLLDEELGMLRSEYAGLVKRYIWHCNITLQESVYIPKPPIYINNQQTHPFNVCTVCRRRKVQDRIRVLKPLEDYLTSVAEDGSRNYGEPLVYYTQSILYIPLCEFACTCNYIV